MNLSAAQSILWGFRRSSPPDVHSHPCPGRPPPRELISHVLAKSRTTAATLLTFLLLSPSPLASSRSPPSTPSILAAATVLFRRRKPDLAGALMETSSLPGRKPRPQRLCKALGDLALQTSAASAPRACPRLSSLPALCPGHLAAQPLPTHSPSQGPNSCLSSGPAPGRLSLPKAR